LKWGRLSVFRKAFAASAIEDPDGNLIELAELRYEFGKEEI
jgi:hypothetical protein